MDDKKKSKQAVALEYDPDDIAPLFEAAKDIENIALPESFWDVLSE